MCGHRLRGRVATARHCPPVTQAGDVPELSGGAAAGSGLALGGRPRWPASGARAASALPSSCLTGQPCSACPACPTSGTGCVDLLLFFISLVLNEAENPLCF